MATPIATVEKCKECTLLIPVELLQDGVCVYCKKAEDVGPKIAGRREGGAVVHLINAYIPAGASRIPNTSDWNVAQRTRWDVEVDKGNYVYVWVQDPSGVYTGVYRWRAFRDGRNYGSLAAFERATEGYKRGHWLPRVS